MVSYKLVAICIIGSAPGSEPRGCGFDPRPGQFSLRRNLPLIIKVVLSQVLIAKGPG